jgi:hypothetical protein
MIRRVIQCGALAGVVTLGACDLEVINPNNPETRRVLATPADVEALLGTTYRRWHIGLYSTLSSIQLMASVLSLENFSSLANNGFGATVSIPRSTLNNAIGNGFATEHRRVYYFASETARTASNVLGKLDDPNFTLNPNHPGQDARARAFAEFVRGISLGYVALFYDSGAVIHPGLGPVDPGVLVGYQELMAAAIGALDAAIASASGWNDNIPAEWLPSNTVWTPANFVRLVRSYRARLRANVARYPAERAAVDWDAVIADAQNGITAHHYVQLNTTTGPTESWRRQAVSSTLWHQMNPFLMGQADVSGSYATWIGQSLDDRGTQGAFFMVTPDERFPQGATRAAQQADFAINCVADATRPPDRVLCKRYFRNRPTGNDNTSGASWGWSHYDHMRFHPFHQNGRSEIELAGSTGGNGFLPYITKAEMDLLEAEGHFRKGNFAAAIALINRTRTQNGLLPALVSVNPNDPVPGGAVNCVPKMAVNAANSGGGTVQCGNMWEALKYEKRIETAYTHFGAWYLDNRGWGDLPENTGVHWAPPFEDYQARGQSANVYSTGGGQAGSAARSGYGW